MAVRPVFLPTAEGRYLVQEMDINFVWSSGFAEVQKKKNIDALHSAAEKAGVHNILEISTKSNAEIGRRLSAFSLKIFIDDGMVPLESAYQSAKIFRKAGPFPEVRRLKPRDAKQYIREKADGDLIGFCLFGRDYPIVPKNAFYDWIYIKSLVDHSKWIESKISYCAFTDIEFNPQKQVNCQARAFATLLSLQKRFLLEKAAAEFEFFSGLISSI